MERKYAAAESRAFGESHAAEDGAGGESRAEESRAEGESRAAEDGVAEGIRAEKTAAETGYIEETGADGSVGEKADGGVRSGAETVTDEAVQTVHPAASEKESPKQ